MIQKSSLDRIIADQQLRLRNSARSFPPQQVTDLPYLTHQMLLIGGVRGSGCTTWLHYLFHNDYPEAWYTDFADPRLDGFDETDFLKLARLIDESGKGVMLFHRVDLTKGWEDFCAQRLSRQQKIVATVGHPTLHRLQRETAPFLREQIISYTLSPLCYGEFLTAHRRNGSTQAVQEYLHRGGFPCNLRNDDPTLLRQLYEEILTRDVLLPQGIRDHATLRRVALHLLTHSGEALSANKLRETLRIKAVSTVTEHMQSLEA
ncbi:MAG: AAA family ATPase, partial [Alistipes sp.]|nr:AAA family ATPase [Alistipes sp.]